MLLFLGDTTASGSQRHFLGRVTDIFCLTSNWVRLTDGYHLVIRSSQLSDSVGVLLGNNDVSWTPVYSNFFPSPLGCNLRENFMNLVALVWLLVQIGTLTKQWIHILRDYSFVWEMENRPKWRWFREHIYSSICLRVDQPLSAKIPS